MPSDSPETNRGRPIDSAPLPDWARPYFSPEQLGLDRGLLWILLVYKARTLKDTAATTIAQRFYVHTIGKAHKKAWPSLPSLMADLELSVNTARVGLARLEADGWLVKQPSPSKSQGYGLAWPDRDCLAPTAEGPVLCAEPTKAGSLCTRRAGRGTRTPGVGPCVDHGGTPKNDGSDYQPLIVRAEAEQAATYQPLTGSDGPSGLPDYQPLTESLSTTDSADYQPLTSEVSAVDTEYVSECVSGVHQMSNEGCPPSRAEVEVPPPTSEPDEDRDVIGEGEQAADDGPEPLPSEVEPKHLTALPEACEHGRPGGHLPADDRPSDKPLWPACPRCQGHIASRPRPHRCPTCDAIREAAGVEFDEEQASA